MVRSWIELRFAGVPISFGEILGMALRGSLKQNLASAIVASHEAQLDISRVTLEAHTLAGGRPNAVVTAALRLAQLDQAFEPQVLGAIDLTSGNLSEVIDAYAQARELHPEFTFTEFVKRHQDGEDVIEASSAGTLAPLAVASGWQVRVEYGPLSTSALRELLDHMRSDAKVTVLRAGSDRWEPASRIRDLISS
jgi:uncharacterized protein YqfA (UPF0365 family)